MAYANPLALACFVLAGIGCVYALAAAVLARRFRPGARPALADAPAVTILKPLHGTDTGQGDDLASFCDQDYRAAVQVLFGVQERGDPAVAIVERLRARYPDRDLRLCITSDARGANPKVANLLGLQPFIGHEVVVIADSDIAVERDYLATIVGALQQPGVGAVTCLYRGEARGGWWARLSAIGINHRFVPGVLVGLALGIARPCFGSTIALRRDTLAAIGGFEAFLAELADDYAIGAAVRATGASVAIPRHVVTHVCSERSAAEWFAHELRWARTVRAVSPAGHAGLLLTHPLPFALVGASIAGFPLVSMAIVATAIACRLVLQREVEHTLRVRSKAGWLGPAHDLLAFAVHVASCFVGVVRWRGHRYAVRADGTLAPTGESRR